jgi:hypothetical protein
VVREGWGQGGEMNQALYAHMNNKRKRKKNKKQEFYYNKVCMCKIMLSLSK